ncbi:alpha-crystallin A chain-like isoform X2 [Daphnia pulex]|uniref:alpha-crystallin A chain-like isoform X2 n=1 Tax=Daphnia pulex TaxID=6669 RepID=UPI001EE10F32|nr:alpha-crystallin A chain-like isoform X2 [Daphnia pulex]XP_046651965.1 alpha-crystallin A chain-like isoform X2 [Daphnia pulicaria]
MALWNYDPYTCVDTTRRRDPWGLFEPEPNTYWPESQFLRSLRSHGVIGSPAIKHPHSTREIVSDKEKYQVTLQVEDFKSNEISVKIVGTSLVVCAEHEEKEDDHGHVFRHIKRRYILPNNVDLDHLSATLSDNGTLVVCAPKKPEETENERVIEVKQLKSEPASQPPSQVSNKPEQQTGKGKVNIPVSHEKSKK